MNLDNIKSEICTLIKDRFNLEEDNDFKNELLSLADKELTNKEILRIKRVGVEIDNWKTLILVEIEAKDEIYIKSELKKAISWIASVKESLLGAENTDLYLFLAFNGEVDSEECLRIESTEQFCRKYVLLPNEDISEFLNRTFFQKFIMSESEIGGDPLEKAFSRTSKDYEWLTSEIQKTWKKAFFELSGNDLADELLKDEMEA
ncbi:MAG: hypothetical protein KAJ18_01890 [Candidatus Omnitrophica bacterium]|nr:hypothetical protein [Candidatus Omnitrophota bacterium]